MKFATDRLSADPEKAARPKRPAGAGYAASRNGPATPNHRTTRPRWLALRQVVRFAPAHPGADVNFLWDTAAPGVSRQ